MGTWTRLAESEGVVRRGKYITDTFVGMGKNVKRVGRRRRWWWWWRAEEFVMYGGKGEGGSGGGCEEEASSRQTNSSTETSVYQYKLRPLGAKPCSCGTGGGRMSQKQGESDVGLPFNLVYLGVQRVSCK